MTSTISTQALAGASEDPECVVVDVREMAAFNGWTCHHEARGGHLCGAVAFPLEWTAIVHGTALQRLLISKGITPHRTVVVYDMLRDRSAAMASCLRSLGYSRVLTYEAGVAAWAADERLPMAQLAHYEKLVHPAWVFQLLHGQSPATYAGHGFVLFEVGWNSDMMLGHGPAS